MTELAFSVGQLVQHKLFGYRGVIYDVDAQFEGSEQWYQQMARSRPPRDKPWYHVLVDGRAVQTYVAQRNLEPDSDLRPVDHPLVAHYFQNWSDGVYQVARQ